MQASIASVCAVVFSVCLSLPVFAKDDVAKDTTLDVAQYQFDRGLYQSGLATILSAPSVNQNSVEYKQLKAKLLVKLRFFSQARELFEELLRSPSAGQAIKDSAFSLAQLNFAYNKCADVERFLQAGVKLSISQQQQAFYMQANCYVKSANVGLGQLTSLDENIKSYVGKISKSERSIWLAYAYYNLSVAAFNIQSVDLAINYYSSMIEYLGTDQESKALYEQALLTQAYAQYEANQYAAAMEVFEQIDLNGYWKDKALLGYGWAAFYNYKRGLALESWRQLLSLPNKSISVYEGLIAIPFALEKANAFGEALNAYDVALAEYKQALEQINTLEKQLTVDQIREHAIAYHNLENDEVLEPLHPLLGATFTKPEFRSVIEVIGHLSAEKTRLRRENTQLSVLKEVLAWQPTESPVLASKLLPLHKRLEQLLIDIIALREFILKDAMAKKGVSENLQEKYRRYAALKRISEASSDTVDERLQKLQGVLLWQLYKEGYYSPEHLKRVNALLAQYRHLQSRLSGMPDTLALTTKPTIDISVINALEVRFNNLEKNNNALVGKAEKHLLDLTLKELRQYKVVITDFYQQTLVANARLKEEFYQLGGRRL